MISASVKFMRSVPFESSPSVFTINLSKYPRLNKKVYPIEAKSSGSYQTSVISRVESKKKKL